MPSTRPALVAYSDSDSESSPPDMLKFIASPEAQIKRMDVVESLLALPMKKINIADSLGMENPTITSSTGKDHMTTAMTEDITTAQVGNRRDGGENQGTNLDNDVETISGISSETHDVECETNFARAHDGTSRGTNIPQCWGDIKYPRIGTCDHEFKIANKGERYRKVVSDFFGRNKKATASVPPDCYPTICRTCYQRLAYRLGSMNKDDPEKDAAAVAKLRCDAIIATLQKMKERKFIDRHGHEWPWWCGLKLQLTNDGQALLDNPEGLKAEIEKKNGEVAKYKADRVKSPEGKNLKRLHKRVRPEYLPDWLQKLCQVNTENDAISDVATSAIGDRNGVRYSFDELILIIKAIKTFCHEIRCAFPTIEAVPVPIGLLDEQILREQRKLRATANKMKTETRKAAIDAEREARDQPSNILRKNKAVIKRKEADKALAEADAAERAVDNAQEDALLSAGTIPGKRRKSDATPSKASKLRTNLSKAKGEKVLQSAQKVINRDTREISEGEFVEEDDVDDADYEDIASTPKLRPAKRARTSIAATKAKTDGRNGSYSDWWKKYGKNLPQPTNAAEFRALMAEARRHDYYPEPQKDRPLSSSDESGDDE